MSTFSHLVTPPPGLADDEKAFIESYDVNGIGYIEMRARNDWIEKHSWRAPYDPPARAWTTQMAQYAKDLAEAREDHNARGWPIDRSATGGNRHDTVGYGWMAARGD